MSLRPLPLGAADGVPSTYAALISPRSPSQGPRQRGTPTGGRAWTTRSSAIRAGVITRKNAVHVAKLIWVSASPASARPRPVVGQTPAGAASPFHECPRLAPLEQLFRIEQSEEFDRLGHQPGPAGLVAGPEPRAVVAVEVLVEQEVVAPVRIGLELLRAAVDGAPAVLVPQEDPRRAGRRSPRPPRRGSSCRPEPVGHSTLKSSP